VFCENPSQLDHYACNTTSGVKICEKEWYDQDCKTYCGTPKHYENHKCDKQTGEKLCNEGWVGEGCNTVNPCIYYRCQNGGSCTLDELLNPECSCTNNYAGVFCHIKKCDEHYYGLDCDVLCQAPAESDHYICDESEGVKICDRHWYGSNCDILCEKPSELDHYTCDHFTGSKVCEEGWIGDTCSIIDECQLQPCENGGSCTIDEYFNASCICTDDWYGPNCDSYCEKPSTNEHYTCHEETGAKICDEGWVGSNCSTVNPCILHECQNDGTCIFEETLGPVCKCHSKFSGVHCEMKNCDNYCMPGKCYSFPNSELFMCICDEPDGQGEYIESRRDEEGMPFKCPVTTTTTTTTTPVPTTTTTKATTTTEKVILPVTPVYYPQVRYNMDCDELTKHGYRYADDVYDIHPFWGDYVTVWCDMDSEGWTVIQRRYDDDTSFDRNWEAYKKPFGDPRPNHSYWIGLQNLYRLTIQRWYTLSITLQMPSGTFKFANYEYFYIENEENGYRLHVYGHSGTAKDTLISARYGRVHNNMKFSTFDNDNDRYTFGNCASKYQSGWWFNDCFLSNLNGVYKKSTNGWPPCNPNYLCIAWQDKSRYGTYSLESVIMKVKPTDPPSNDIIETMKRGY